MPFQSSYFRPRFNISEFYCSIMRSGCQQSSLTIKCNGINTILMPFQSCYFRPRFNISEFYCIITRSGCQQSSLTIKCNGKNTIWNRECTLIIFYFIFEILFIMQLIKVHRFVTQANHCLFITKGKNIISTFLRNTYFF